MRRIQEEINALEAEKFFMLEKIVDENFLTLVKEIKNLETGCGDGYREGDYYAPARYYSSIDGIKNIRIRLSHDGYKVLVIKVYSRKGEDLVKHIIEYYTIPGIDKIEIHESARYCEEINY